MQEKENYCLCSVISDIFSEYNINKSQEGIAKELTSTKRGFKVDDNRIKSLMNNSGFEYGFYWWNETPLGEPDYLLKEIQANEGFVGLEGHVFRIIEFNDPELVVLDPATEIPKSFEYSSLIQQLKEHDGEFGLIKKIYS